MRLPSGKNHSGRRMGLQLFQSHKFQSRSVRRVKVYWGSNTSLQRFMPANHAKAPAVSLLQSGKAGLGRHQIVAAGI
jgi:hypothetical protein